MNGVNDKAFIAIPCYGGNINYGLFAAVLNAGKTPVNIAFKSGSLLACSFNSLVVEASQTDATHFLLIHSDIAPEDGFVDKAIAIMKRDKLDVLSALVPIKNMTGTTSTALERYPVMRRITMHEAHNLLPPTFGPADTLRVFGTKALLFNSGFLCVRMKAVDWARAHFNISDEIKRMPDGRLQAFNMPEDWFFSRKVIDLGLSCAVTREISVTHYGEWRWSNQTVYGQETDVVANEAYERAMKEDRTQKGN